jgi:uncharacterized protein
VRIDTERVKGATVVVTGGSSGIGKRLALDMARLGAQVAIASHDPERLRVAEQELLTVSRRCFSVTCDISRQEDVSRMATDVLRRFGHVDILINNAGYAVYHTFESTDVSEICRLAEVNLLGAIRCIRVFLPGMIERRTGRIVNMASIAGRIPLTPNSVYCASKHGLVALSQALRYELQDFNVRVHVICPGRAETPFFDHQSFKTRAVRPETGYTVTVDEISKATIRAIEKERFLTYVPRTLGVLAWSMSALPWVVEPLFRRLMVARIRSYYSNRDRTRPNTRQPEAGHA